jgi:flavodoxin
LIGGNVLKTLIVYATKYGFTKNCAEELSSNAIAKEYFGGGFI